jgi:hypothetical protein
VVFLSEGLISSARRWDHNGVLRTTAVHLLLRSLYLMKVPPQKLATIHQKHLRRDAAYASPPPASQKKKPAPKAN